MKRILARIIRASLVLLSLSIFIAAQKTVVPIVYFDEADSADEQVITHGILVGGVENGKWLNSKNTYAKLKGNEKFFLLNFVNGSKGVYSLGEFKGDSLVCQDNYYIEPQLKVAANFALGSNATWNALPRQTKKVSLTDANYKKSVADVLGLHGLRKSPVKIDKALRVDLDGDGADEVILEAHYTAEDADQNLAVGTYSSLIVRKIVGGKVRNLFVGGFFLTKKDEIFDGDYKLSGIADLNGDGKMELIVDIQGYEENWTKIFEMKTGKPAEIKALSYYCGV